MTPKPQTPASDGNGAGHRGMGARVDSLGRAAQSFSQELRGTATDLGRALDLRGRARRHPYAMMIAAVGVGYLLGGGLFTRTTGRLVGLAGRVAGLPLMRAELIGLAEVILSRQEGAASSSASSDIPSPS